MAKQTSANMQPCKGGAAERHNRRDKELDYVRKDLTCLNCYKEWIPIEQQMKHIRAEYQAVTGQHLQATAQPIQEIVLVIDKETTQEQVEKFCSLIKTLGMTPLSYAIHKDEGHKDAKTGEWIPNYHSHIIVDTTCWEHRLVERTKKRNGKNVIDPKTKKPVKIKVDAYAKTIKFSREDLYKLQDFAAEATGLERGVSSNRNHEQARQYKAREQAREIERQAKAIEEQKALIRTQEKTMRDSVLSMQEKGNKVLKNYDIQEDKLRYFNLSYDKKLTEWRDWLEMTTKEDLSKAPMSRILNLVQPLSNAITIVAMATSVMASAAANSLLETVKEKEKVLAELTRQIKERSVWKSVKGAILSLIDKPANNQVKHLMSEVESAKAETEEVRKDLEAKDQEVACLEGEISHLRWQKSNTANTIKRYDELVKLKISENEALGNQISDLKFQHEVDKSTMNEWRDAFIEIAKDLVDHASAELLQRYESRGLHKMIGEKLWQWAKDTREQRWAEEQQPSTTQSRGIHM